MLKSVIFKDRTPLHPSSRRADFHASGFLVIFYTDFHKILSGKLVKQRSTAQKCPSAHVSLLNIQAFQSIDPI